MKLWTIERIEFWDERDSEPKGPSEILPCRPHLFGASCRWKADGWSLVSDHNTYSAVRVSLPFSEVRARGLDLGGEWLKYGVPRTLSFHLSNVWNRILVRLPEPLMNLVWRFRCRGRKHRA